MAKFDTGTEIGMDPNFEKSIVIDFLQRIWKNFFENFSGFFFKLFKIQNFQMTGNAPKRVLNESLENSKTFGWKI